MTTTAPFVDAYHRDGFVELPNLPGDTPLDRILSVPAGLVITDILGHPGGVSQVRPAGGVDMEWVALDDDDGIEAWVSTGTRAAEANAWMIGRNEYVASSGASSVWV